VVADYDDGCVDDAEGIVLVLTMVVVLLVLMIVAVSLLFVDDDDDWGVAMRDGDVSVVDDYGADDGDDVGVDGDG